MSKRGLLILAAAFVPAVMPAQDAPNDRVIKAIATRYEAPGCDIKTGHFKVSSAATYLKSAYENPDGPRRERLLRDADRVLREAVTENEQADNGALWYYQGRVNLMQGDLRGADSAFTKAERMLPECREEIKHFRQRAGTVLTNPAGEFAKADKSDSALALFRESLVIYREFPTAYYNMGILFTNAEQADSAAWYFTKAAELAAADPRFTELRNQATFNVAALHQRANRHEEAVATLRRYVEWVPGDVEARKALAVSLRATGKADEAQALDKDLLASGAASGTLTSSDLMSLGVNFFNEKKYAEAAEAFQKVADMAPYDRYAWFNLANSHLALKDGPKLVLVGKKLVELEPLNEDHIKLLGEGYRLNKQQDELIATVTGLIGMPTSIAVDNFSRTKGGAKLEGVATGRQAQSAGGKDLPAKAVTVHIHFLDNGGKVVASKDLEIHALEPLGKHPFVVEAEGEGIVAYRYEVKK
ncbi:MAG: tetratricopeptide repeat protein [Gemmatimonadales bacterium]|nr:tetratricopeptide repeat protein [Gemmatimonadales bacterium]